MLGDLPSCKPDAARAQHAAFVIQHNARPEVDVLRLMHFLLEESANLPLPYSMLKTPGGWHSPAWSQMGQSSGWLISRNSMHSLAALPAPSVNRCARPCLPPTSCAQEICGRGIHAKFPGWPSAPISGLAIRPHFGHAHFNKTHAAIARRRKLGMITIARHE